MHLASHGLMVATLDHSEVVAPEVAGNVEGFTANRVLDARFLLDYMLAGAIPCIARPDADRIAIVSDSIGGWTVLVLPETDTRIQAVVARRRALPIAGINPAPTSTARYTRLEPRLSFHRTNATDAACT
jgi:predicted dienelactone hydrolase